MRYISYLIILVVFHSCSRTEVDKLQIKLGENRIDLAENLKYCIVIPTVGCGGCIDEGMSFLKRNQKLLDKHRSEVWIVFTSIISKKMLRLSMKDIDLPKSMIYYDVNNAYSAALEQSIYPSVLYLDNGNLQRLEFQSPEHSYTFTELEKILKSDEL